MQGAIKSHAKKAIDKSKMNLDGRPRNLASLQRGLAATTFATPVEEEGKGKMQKEEKEEEEGQGSMRRSVHLVQATSSSPVALNSTLWDRIICPFRILLAQLTQV